MPTNSNDPAVVPADPRHSDDAHPEDVFVTAFVTHVRACAGDGPLTRSALPYAQDVLDEVAEAIPLLDLRSPRFRAALRDYAAGSHDMLAVHLRRFAREPSHSPPARGAALAQQRSAA